MLTLGLVIDSEGKVVVRRTMLKILLNPFLCYFLNKKIASVIDDKQMKFIEYRLVDCPRYNSLRGLLKDSWCFDLEESCKVVALWGLAND